MNTAASHPILTCDQAQALENDLFSGGEAAEWAAMQRAGRSVAGAILADFDEIGGFPDSGSMLVLAGKGHNGGDGLIAARAILDRFPRARADIVFVLGEKGLRPLARKAWRELVEAGKNRVSAIHSPVDSTAGPASGRHPKGISRRAVRGRVGDASLPPSMTGETPVTYALCLDGIFGLQFRPPMPAKVAAALRWANGLAIGLRAAVDLPSGLGEGDAFRADFTYATGVVKTPLLQLANAGRPRYLDLGFFAGDSRPEATERVLTASVLEPLGKLRPPRTDKRSFGHMLVFGGSRDLPGSVLMVVLAALRSGTGLVTAFVPRSLAAAHAARAPEAMWVGWPETADGGLAAEGIPLFEARLERASAIVIGPGMGQGSETHDLLRRVIRAAAARPGPPPVLLDADALQPDLVRGAGVPLVLTPHVGEFSRIAGAASLQAFCSETGATVLLKGPVTRIAAHGSGGRVYVHYSFFGGPVLARGGSGDILAGLIGSLLAQKPSNPLLCACQGTVWHGLAADLLARSCGQTAVSVTQLLDFLPKALRLPPIIGG